MSLRHRGLALAAICALALLPLGVYAAPTQQDGALPPAEIENDEGGPTSVAGELAYEDFTIPLEMQSPAPTLLDLVHVILGERTLFAPVESQIHGYMTSPLTPAPMTYAANLPAEPTGTLLDLDNDGEEDAGVQVFAATIGANITGGSDLVQLDQVGTPFSYLTDPITGDLISGSLLVWAPDDEQGFPAGFGEDGILFTEDDPAVALPAGYTIVHFGPDGFTFDRSASGTIDVLDNPAAASPDFSEMAPVEAFAALLDHLKIHYSYNEYRNIDWDALYAEFLPQIEQAEDLVTAGNVQPGAAVYSLALHTMAQRIRDAHVASVITDPQFGQASRMESLGESDPIALNLGANTAELTDGGIIVTDVLDGSPAAEAGWTLGTQILSVDGVAVEDRIPGVIYNETVGTDANQRLRQVENLLKFPAPDDDDAAPADVVVEAILTGETEAQEFTLTPGEYALPSRLDSPAYPMPITYRVGPPAAWIHWSDFTQPNVTIAVFEQFLKEVQEHAAVNGIVLDMRGNTGGWDMLYFTLASYFFNAENPVNMHWIDEDVMDTETGEFVRQLAPEFLLSAPKPELYYGGPLVVLVDQNCASSCEFFSQFLQNSGRATVVAEHATKGAGASINRVTLPLGSIFQYTKGRAYFAGTDQFNLEGTGVTPDVLSPVTIESIEETFAGGDPVLAAGNAEIGHIVGQQVVEGLNLVPFPDDAGLTFTSIYPEAWNASPANEEQVAVVSPDGRFSITFFALPQVVTPEQLMTAIRFNYPLTPLDGYTSSHDTGDVEWSIDSFEDENHYAYRLATSSDGTNTNFVLMASPAITVDALQEGLLIPALDAFELVAQ